MVFAAWADYRQPTVTLHFPAGPVSLHDALATLADAAGLRVAYHVNGIVVSPVSLAGNESVAAEVKASDEFFDLHTGWQVKKQAMAAVVAKYPAVGTLGSTANMAFLAIYAACGADPEQAESVADLVMVYPLGE